MPWWGGWAAATRKRGKRRGDGRQGARASQDLGRSMETISNKHDSNK